MHYLDVTSFPRTNVLKELSEYAGDPKEKEFLLSLTHTTPESKVGLRHLGIVYWLEQLCMLFNYLIFVFKGIVMEIE